MNIMTYIQNITYTFEGPQIIFKSKDCSLELLNKIIITVGLSADTFLAHILEETQTFVGLYWEINPMGKKK